MSQWQRIFFQTACLQTLSQLMFNKFKQDCFDTTASRIIRLTVHFDEEGNYCISLSHSSVLRHWTAAQLMPRKGWLSYRRNMSITTGNSLSDWRSLDWSSICWAAWTVSLALVRVDVSQSKLKKLTADEVLAHWRNTSLCPTSKCVLYFLLEKQNKNTSRCISNTKYKIQICILNTILNTCIWNTTQHWPRVGQNNNVALCVAFVQYGHVVQSWWLSQL